MSLIIDEPDERGGQDEFVQGMRRALCCRKQGVLVLVMNNSNVHLTFLCGNRVKMYPQIRICAYATEVLFVDINL